MPSPQRRYRPGTRRVGKGKMSDARVAWARTVVGQFIIYYFDRETDVELPDEVEVNQVPEKGPDVYLILPRQGRKPFTICLTALTSEELGVMREIFNLGFDLAEPVVVERDAVAEAAAADGDDSFARSYRQIPQFVKRPGTVAADSAGIRERLDNLPNRGGTGRSDSGGVRESSDVLAEPGTDDASSEDDET